MRSCLSRVVGAEREPNQELELRAMSFGRGGRIEGCGAGLRRVLFKTMATGIQAQRICNFGTCAGGEKASERISQPFAREIIQ